MNYFARLSLNFTVEANQRLSYLRSLSTLTKENNDSMAYAISNAFQHHCLLSEIGHKIVYCNHSWRANLEKRLVFAKQLGEDLITWRQSLPDMLH